MPGWDYLQTLAWAVDGRSIFATNFKGVAEKTTIIRVDLQGRVQVVLESQTPGEWLGRLYPSPDGRYLAYGARTYSESFWILDDF